MTAVVPLDGSAAFALAMVRFIGLFLVAPFFSHAVVPMRVRMALAFAATWATADLWSGAQLPLLEIGPAAAAVVHEALVGVTLGFATGLVFSASAFAQKMGWTIGGATALWMLGSFGYQANVEQAPETLTGLKLLMSAIPAVGAVLAAAVMFLYKLDDRFMAKIEADLAERRAEKGE